MTWLVFVGVGLDGGIHMLSRRLAPCLFIDDGLQAEMLGVRLALDIGGDPPLEQFLMSGRDTLRGRGEGDRL
jgi:hypothetical protein